MKEKTDLIGMMDAMIATNEASAGQIEQLTEQVTELEENRTFQDEVIQKLEKDKKMLRLAAEEAQSQTNSEVSEELAALMAKLEEKAAEVEAIKRSWCPVTDFLDSQRKHETLRFAKIGPFSTLCS